MSERKEMSFLDHLEELRWRLVKSAIVIIIIAIAIWWNMDWIMRNIFMSMLRSDFVTYDFFCSNFKIMCVDHIPASIQSRQVGGQFGYAIWMSFIGGVVLGFPFIFHQIWSFVRPGLKTNEQNIVRGIVFYVSMLFFFGIMFGYFVVAPMSVHFFGTFKITSEIQNEFDLNSYMSTIISTVFYSGLFFLLPVVAYLFGKLGIITPAFLRKYRKHAIVGVLILSAIITPPDMISQVIVSIPILLLYEISIFVVVAVEKKRNKES
ncbi:MAG: Sec-independent protein translocase, TatC subunit [Crocinitomicaceae bacterium]|jgi:sec-independent protein translocase protein TatC|nr:Sec-independent protein translocase, TatC subunit [Crocinitomicaceae bacterium]